MEITKKVKKEDADSEMKEIRLNIIDLMLDNKEDAAMELLHKYIAKKTEQSRVCKRCMGRIDQEDHNGDSDDK